MNKYFLNIWMINLWENIRNFSSNKGYSTFNTTLWLKHKLRRAYSRNSHRQSFVQSRHFSKMLYLWNRILQYEWVTMEYHHFKIIQITFILKAILLLLCFEMISSDILCKTVLLEPWSVAKRIPLPSIIMKPNLWSSSNNA